MSSVVIFVTMTMTKDPNKKTARPEDIFLPTPIKKSNDWSLKDLCIPRNAANNSPDTFLYILPTWNLRKQTTISLIHRMAIWQKKHTAFRTVIKYHKVLNTKEAVICLSSISVSTTKVTSTGTNLPRVQTSSHTPLIYSFFLMMPDSNLPNTSF